jgi:cytochrome c oxidase cbb3-type subunit 3
MTRPLLLALILPGAAAASAAETPGKPPAETLELYETKCQSCHMADGNSPLEPLNFADTKWIHGSAPEAVAKVISEGAEGTAMLPFKEQLTPAQIAELAAYVRSFDKTLKPARAKKPAARKPPAPKPSAREPTGA